MTDLTRSMRVSAVVIFLLLERSDSLARCSWPPPGLIIEVMMMINDDQDDDDDVDENYDHHYQENNGHENFLK